MIFLTSDSQKNRIKRLLDDFKNNLHNETLWTWIVAKIIEEDLNHNTQCYSDLVFDKKFTNIQKINIGYEVQPISPRKGEGNTHLDLALGSIVKREKTDGGIQYQKDNFSSVCFVEAKLFSDISISTKNNEMRNQIIRVIENLLCFQNKDGEFPHDICFTLLTPRKFKCNPNTRLYGYKYFEYLKDLISGGNLIIDEINQLNLEKRNESDWEYPDLSQRIKKLRLNWLTYEDIFEKRFKIKFAFPLIDESDIKLIVDELKL